MSSGQDIQSKPSGKQNRESDKTVRHVRRPARTIGGAMMKPESPQPHVVTLFPELKAHQHTRSYSTDSKPVSRAQAESSTTNRLRRSSALPNTQAMPFTTNGGLNGSEISKVGNVPGTEANTQIAPSSSSASTEYSASPQSMVGASETSMLQCPICGVMAPNLFSLNIHLDDTHFGGEASPVQQRIHESVGRRGSSSSLVSNAHGRRRPAAQDDLDDVKGTILGFLRGAGKAVKGLGVQQNTETSSITSSEAGETTAAETPSSYWGPNQQDNAECGSVTKSHWQALKPGSRCSVPACGRVLNTPGGALNCRKCGRLMCTQHCGYCMRLSPTAQPSARGFKCRVCEECYTRSTGTRAGPSRNLTAAFFHHRRKAVNTAILEGNRLEKRLEKLSFIHSELSTVSSGTSTTSFFQKRALQAAEQNVVIWQDDSEVQSCPLCHRSFGRLSSRRHHCRLCGRVVCSRSSCLSGLSIPLPDGTGGFSPDSCADIKICCECEHVVIRHRDRAARARMQPDELALLYTKLKGYMKQVDEVLPTFNAIALRLHDSEYLLSPDLPRATRIRRQLTDAFNRLDAVSKSICKLPPSSQTEARLHVAIRQAVAQYLQLHMFPLTMIPKSNRSMPSTRSLQAMGNAQREPTPLRHSTTVDGIASSPDQPLMPAMGPPLDNSTMEDQDHSSEAQASILQDKSQDNTKGTMSKSTLHRVLSGGLNVAGSTAGGVGSLLAYITPGRNTAVNGSNAGLQNNTDASDEVAEIDPSRKEQISNMPQSEKLTALSVLREQRERVKGYINDARKERRIEDAVSLQASLKDLEIELSLIEQSL